MIEVWKDIPDYEGLYQVSNLGRVKALKKEWLSHHTAILTHGEKIIKPYLNHNGYLRVALSKDNKYHKFPVHRLVANAFIGKQPSDDYVINHKDYNRQNNCVDNLEWLTQKENSIYSKENARKSALTRLKPRSKEHYIYHRKLATTEHWFVYIKHKYYQFTSLEEAKDFRNKHLNDLLRGKEIYLSTKRLKKRDIK